MRLFKKKKTIELFNPINGNVVALSSVHDEVFASGAIGTGFGIFPSNGDIYSPTEATVTAIFPTKHAISLVTKNGIEILIHIGIDTVELNGEGFEILVDIDDKVDKSTLLAKVDLNYLKMQNKKTDIMVIFTNLNDEKLSLDLGENLAMKKIGTID
ncbi:PTS sugar transporter subunit IIA [Enterococcus durans]|uniref:PTS sugar transporter subunit IIA n=1 Tax=Enterococcus durans TaxID=53345 RepID=UPI00189D18CC|nr:PTS glucose transporter subunit IIA [Enterococcus durans]